MTNQSNFDSLMTQKPVESKFTFLNEKGLSKKYPMNSASMSQ